MKLGVGLYKSVHIFCLDFGYGLWIGTAGSLFVCGQKTLSETIGEFWWDYNKQLQKLLGKLLGTIRKIVI